MKYIEQITQTMTELAKNDKVIFIGQSVKYPGHVMYHTLKDVPDNQKIEVPVFEDMQMGMSIGLALGGYLPISIYPRMDFLMIAMNQLLNHLDKIKEMSKGEFNPKVIIRTMIGCKKPLDGGPQHTGNYISGLSNMLKNISVIEVRDIRNISQLYNNIFTLDRSIIFVESGEKYNG
jgi:pyruvate/2-oxoglutarate/acetoin dehydrogenase E1 component